MLLLAGPRPLPLGGQAAQHEPGEAVETDEKPQVEALSHVYARPGSGKQGRQSSPQM